MQPRSHVLQPRPDAARKKIKMRNFKILKTELLLCEDPKGFVINIKGILKVMISQ